MTRILSATSWLVSRLQASGGSMQPATSAAVAPGPDPNAHWRALIEQVQATAKWLIGAFAAVGTLLVAGSQLSDLGEVDGAALALALAGLGVALLGVGLAIWSLGNVVAPRPPVSTGDLVRLAEARRGSFAQLLRTSPELLQEQAGSVEELHTRLIAARRRRHQAEQQLVEQPENRVAAAARARADRQVQDLRTVASQLRPIAAYLEARDGFRRARVVAFGGAAMAAAGAVAFAYGTHSSKDKDTSAVLPPRPTNVTVHFSEEGRRILRGALGSACPADAPGLVLGGDADAYDMVVLAPACSVNRLSLTPELGTVTPVDAALSGR